jgi:TctA family transporter
VPDGEEIKGYLKRGNICGVMPGLVPGIHVFLDAK